MPFCMLARIAMMSSLTGILSTIMFAHLFLCEVEQLLFLVKESCAQIGFLLLNVKVSQDDAFHGSQFLVNCFLFSNKLL